MAERNGKRKTRDQLLKRRIPELGYYCIVTDTNETEQNYMRGLRDSIPQELREKLVIKVFKAKTVKLVNEALSLISLHPQYVEPWIVFDRDQVIGFDKIIATANAKGIKVGWSNPCIEIWFNAYFGVMPAYQDSISCCSGFEDKFLKVTGQKYKKSDAAIYAKLCRFGNEDRAICIAEERYALHRRNCNDKPSEMCPATTVHMLVREIKNRTKLT